MRCRILLSKLAQKQVQKLPRHVVRKLQSWVEQTENEGLTVTRKTPGFHDEPLKGKRQGQRSIRLSRSYRAIYVASGHTGLAELVRVEEVNHHEY